MVQILIILIFRTMKPEFKTKLDRLTALMEVEGFDAVYIKREDNFAWLTCGGVNYVSNGDVGNCGLLVTKSQSLHAITNISEGNRMKDEEKLVKLGFTLHVGSWQDNTFDAKTISSIVGEGKVGYDTSSASAAIKELRYSLTKEEISRYKKIGTDVSVVLEEVANEINREMTENDVAGLILKKMKEKGIECIVCLVATDERIRNYRHPIPTDKKLGLLVQFGGNFKRSGLVVSSTRFVSFAPVSEEFRKQFLDNLYIDCVYMKNTIIGKPYSYALQKGKETYASCGYSNEFSLHHQGGATGYSGRDIKVTEATEGSVVLNQAFAWNPTITGTKCEDTYVVTDEGIITISGPINYPKIKITVDGEKFIRPYILLR